MIDIIIPCYNAHKTIDRCLGSILAQRVLPSIHVTLVNDAGKSYDDVIKRYSPVMDIQEIVYPVNGGPAKARNFGLQNTNHELVMFMDSDDALADPFSVIKLANAMYDDPKNVIVISNFIEEVAPLTFTTHTDDTSFMHGKMYRRNFLQKYNILQNEQTRCNEDVGFNILALLIADNIQEKVKRIEYVSYYWLQNPESLVRSDKDNYDNSTSYRGFADNLAYVFEELGKRNLNSPNILAEKVTSMQRLIMVYKHKAKTHPQFQEGNLAALEHFYKVAYAPIKHQVTEKLFDEVYENLLKAVKTPCEKSVIKEFLAEMEGTSVNVQI